MATTDRPIKRRYNNTRDIQGDLLKALAKQYRKGRDGATVRELQELIGEPTVSETAIRDNLKVMARPFAYSQLPWVGKLDTGSSGRRWAITGEGERVAISRGYIRERKAPAPVSHPATPGIYVTTTGAPTGDYRTRHQFVTVADLAHIIATADGDRLVRSEELAQAIIDALSKET